METSRCLAESRYTRCGNRAMESRIWSAVLYSNFRDRTTSARGDIPHLMAAAAVCGVTTRAEKTAKKPSRAGHCDRSSENGWSHDSSRLGPDLPRDQAPFR